MLKVDKYKTQRERGDTEREETERGREGERESKRNVVRCLENESEKERGIKRE